MPGNLAAALPSGVMPASLCTAFTELRESIGLQNEYHDGTPQRGQLVSTSRRTFRLSKKLTSAALATLKTFYDGQGGGLTPFFFYNPFDATPGTATGSNYDATGNSTVGRVTAVFRGDWSQSTGMLRTDVPQLELIEVA